jgi:hypothetical protein
VNPLSGVFGEAWELYRGHWRHFFSIAFVVFAILVAAAILLDAVLGWFGYTLATLISLAGTFWLQGTLIEAVRDVRDGRADLSVAETFSRVYPKLGTIIVTGILLGLAIAIGFILIIPGLYLLTIWIAVIPAIVLEDRGIGESFGRSRELVRGNGWNVFGVIVLTFLILLAVWLLAVAILSPLDYWLGALVRQLLWTVVLAPFVVAVWTLVYYRLSSREAAAPAQPDPGPEAAG